MVKDKSTLTSEVVKEQYEEIVSRGLIHNLKNQGVFKFQTLLE